METLMGSALVFFLLLAATFCIKNSDAGQARAPLSVRREKQSVLKDADCR